MKVILQRQVEKLGTPGEVVTVADGDAQRGGRAGGLRAAFLEIHPPSFVLNADLSLVVSTATNYLTHPALSSRLTSWLGRTDSPKRWSRPSGTSRTPTWRTISWPA